MRILAFFLFFPVTAAAQWRPTIIPPADNAASVRENLRRASFWSNRKLDRFGDGTVRGSLVITGSSTITDIIMKNPHADVRAYGAKGDGVTDDTNAFEDAQNSFAAGNKGTVFIPKGNYILNDFPPRSGISFVGTGLGSRLKSTTTHVITSTKTVEFVTFKNLSIVTIAGKIGVYTTDDGYNGHFTFDNIQFEAPSSFGIYGQFVLSSFVNCTFGYYPGAGSQLATAGYLTANAAGTHASNFNRFEFNRFYRSTAPAVVIIDHGYSNVFDTNDFETLDNKAFDITNGNTTKIINNWFENLNLVSNTENSVIHFRTVNDSNNVVSDNTFAGALNNTARLISLSASANPVITFESNSVSAAWDNMEITELHGNHRFTYGYNVIQGTGSYITSNGYDFSDKDSLRISSTSVNILPYSVYTSTFAGNAAYIVADNTFFRTIDGNQQIIQQQTYRDGSGGGLLDFKHARGTLLAPTITTLNTEMGGVRFQGYDGAAWITGAQIKSIVDNTASSGN